jgi:hypothetical protein
MEICKTVRRKYSMTTRFVPSNDGVELHFYANNKSGDRFEYIYGQVGEFVSEEGALISLNKDCIDAASSLRLYLDK